MPALFHQNMLRFYGSKDRKDRYAAAFAAIAGAHAPIEVAGFTEIMSNSDAVKTSLDDLCATLGIGYFATIFCSTMIGREYVSIGVSPGVKVIGVGRFFINPHPLPFGDTTAVINDVYSPDQDFATWCETIPRKYAGHIESDYRLVVYVMINPGGGRAPYAAGFMHNRYTDEARRYIAMQQIPLMANLMGANEDRPVYIGGDFNTEYDNAAISGARVQPKGIPFTASPPPLVPPPRLPLPAFKPGGTTWAGSFFDYWYTNVGGVTPNISHLTLDSSSRVRNLMSDHAAILLDIT